MSAKILSSMTDDNKNLQKQIGCMNGIFQIFDRHHFLTSRRLRSHNHKKLLTGASPNVELAGARTGTMERTGQGRELVNEKHRNSTESARTSTSSSFSSLDQSTSAQQEPIQSGRRSFTETLPQTTHIKQQCSSVPSGHQSSVDLRDVVKDSMYREARGLSIKVVSKEEGRSYVVKHIDSPRPFQQPKSGQPRSRSVDGSTRAKQCETQWKNRDEKDRSSKLGPKDPPRFSYDSRDLRDATKSRLKELPRLSLDNRDIRSPACESKANSLLTDLRRDDRDSVKTLDLGQETPSKHMRSSSVITKLMGLEALPNSASTNQAELLIPDEYSIPRSPHTADVRRQNQVPRSPRVSQKSPDSPRPSKISSVTKQTSSPRFPQEQAPWRQPGSRRSLSLDVGSAGVSEDAPSAPSTVYGEIERRITELEFKGSGKDLRALKQILEAMQKTRQRLENQSAKKSDLEAQTSRCALEYSNCDQDPKSITWQKRQNNQHLKGTSPPPERPDSSIVIMKPIKLVEKFRNSSSPPVSAAEVPHIQKLRAQDAKYKRVNSVDERIPREQVPRNSNVQDRNWRSPSMDKKNKEIIPKVVAISRESKHIKGESYTPPGRSSGLGSPRSQQKKHVIDKQNHPNTRSSDLLRARTQANKVSVDPGSPNRKLKVKSTNVRRGERQTRELTNEMRTWSHQDDSASLLSESNNSSGSQNDAEVTSIVSSENDSKKQGRSRDKDRALRLSEDVPTSKLAIAVMEQPSPVSVLDSTFYGEDSPSPLKKISTVFTDDESVEADEAIWHAENLDNWEKIRRPHPGFEFSNNKLENINELVHKLKLLNPEPDEITVDYSTALCDCSNPDHQYIAKILLASGLLKDVSLVTRPIQSHSLGHQLNPDLFYVLEQTEGRTKLLEEEFDEKTTQFKANEKIHRKIVFDTINEILVQKLSSESIFLRRSQNGQELLKELNAEVDFLKNISNCSMDDEEDQIVSIFNADMRREVEDWATYSGEMPALVLDIERLIFKDLISEAINDEMRGLENLSKRPCRQLFTK